MSDWNDLVRFQRGRLPTAVIGNPKGTYSVVGSVPESCYGKIYHTEQEAIIAVEAAGITTYQKADCSWVGR